MAAMTVDRFRWLVGEMGRESDGFMRKDGFVQETLIGLHPTVGVRFTVVVADAEPSGVDRPDVIVVPPPLQAQAEVLRALFVQAQVEAVVWRGEVWMFPEDDPQAGERFFRGEGPPPSQHPNRAEAVMVSGFWPLRGVTEFLARRIVRSPSGAYTRPWIEDHGDEAGGDGSVVSFLTSWLEELLPAPGS